MAAPSSSNEAQETDIWRSMANLLLHARPDGYDVQLDTADVQGTHPPEPNSLRANFACLQLHAYTGEGVPPLVLGANWLGTSRSSKVKMPDGIAVVSPGKSGGASLISSAPRPLAGGTFRQEGRQAHDGCSEVALLNLLHEVLQHHFLYQPSLCDEAQLLQIEPDARGNYDWRGHLYLLTERAPCDLCTPMLADFLCRYTNLTFTLGYMLEAPVHVQGAPAPIPRGIETFLNNFKPGRSTETYLVEVISQLDLGRSPESGKQAPWSPANYRPRARTDWDIHLLRIVDGAGKVMYAPGLGRAPGTPSSHFAARIAPGSC